MKKVLIIFSLIFILASCTKVYEGQNVDPNNPTAVNAETLLRGMELANISVQVSHIQRITGMWMNQYKGQQLLYQSLGEYNISGEESNDTWQYVYQRIAKQGSVIREALPTNKSYGGITKIIEANALGTATALYGDIPFSERANDAFPVPKFDKQLDVYAGIQLLLTDAITNLSAASPNAILTNDIFAHKSSTWIRIAYTLKARYYMETREYQKAYDAAVLGINATTLSWKFYPPGLVPDGDYNLLNTLVDQRGGYMSTAGSYLNETLLKSGQTGNRNNAKTNEDARLKYYKISGSSASTELGVARKDAPMPLVTYEENLLILAEAGLRLAGGFTEGLTQLNKVRAVLRTNLGLTAMPPTGGTILYTDYVLADFQPGGMENPGTLTQEKALLKEIIEERYVTLYGTILPFNDARRLRKLDNDVNVPIPFTTVTATKHPERVIYAQNELNSNPNVPSPVPDLYTKTQLNQ